MPSTPMRVCAASGCAALTTESRCPQHARERDLRRGTAKERGYDARWRRARRLFLKANPLCVACLADGKTTAASVVDHVVPHRGDQGKFWDVVNWAGLCKRHHDAKTGAGR
jgi:5-methylcytosine-specific restriction enzyme A